MCCLKSKYEVIHSISDLFIPKWVKSPKNSQKECVFFNSAQYTPTDCFFGNFAHWVVTAIYYIDLFISDEYDLFS